MPYHVLGLVQGIGTGNLVMRLSIGGSPETVYSSDGSSWSVLSDTNGPGSAHSYVKGNGTVVAGGSGSVSNTAGSTISTGWSSNNSIGLSGQVGKNALGFTGSEFIAATDQADGQISRSPDGITWTPETVVASSPPEIGNGVNGGLISVNGTDIYVAMGSTDLEVYYNSGSGWTALSNPFTSPEASRTGSRVNASNGVGFVTVPWKPFQFNHRVIYRTTDGVTWNSSGILDNVIYTTVESDGTDFIFISGPATGGDYSVRKSTNAGGSFTEIATIPDNRSSGSTYLTHHNGNWYLSYTTASGVYLGRSADGITWTDLSSSLPANTTFVGAMDAT